MGFGSWTKPWSLHRPRMLKTLRRTLKAALVAGFCSRSSNECWHSQRTLVLPQSFTIISATRSIYRRLSSSFLLKSDSQVNDQGLQRPVPCFVLQPCPVQRPASCLVASVQRPAASVQRSAFCLMRQRLAPCAASRVWAAASCALGTYGGLQASYRGSEGM